MTELCNNALVRTATFYKHFRDKYDFFAFMVRELREERNDAIKSDSSLSGDEYYLAVIRAGLGFLEDHEVLIKAVESDGMMGIIVETTGVTVHEDLVCHMEADQQKGCDLVASPELTAELFIGSMNQVSRSWFANQKRVSADQVVELMAPFVHRLLHAE